MNRISTNKDSEMINPVSIKQLSIVYLIQN